MTITALLIGGAAAGLEWELGETFESSPRTFDVAVPIVPNAPTKRSQVAADSSAFGYRRESYVLLPPLRVSCDPMTSRHIDYYVAIDRATFEQCPGEFASDAALRALLSVYRKHHIDKYR